MFAYEDQTRLASELVLANCASAFGSGVQGLVFGRKTNLCFNSVKVAEELVSAALSNSLLLQASRPSRSPQTIRECQVSPELQH